MSGAAKSRGQALFTAVVSYILRYVVFPKEPTPYQAEVLALWCLQTWVHQKFPICSYAQVAATTKRSGKTLVEHVARLVCRNPSDILVTFRLLSVARWIEFQEGLCTVFFDEAERLNSKAASDTRSMLAAGYKAGATHMVATNKETFWFRTFGPKMFALIGDMVDVLFDRCVPFECRRISHDPPFDYYGETLTAEAIAEQIKGEIMRGGLNPDPVFVMPMFLNGRNREVFAPLWSVALSLKLDEATMDKIMEAFVDMAASKDRELRHFVNMDAEKEAADDGASLRALRDLASVMPKESKTATGDIFSAEAVERLKGIKLGPWRWFRGGPLTEKTLAGLLAPYVGSNRSPVAMERGRGKAKARGYRGSDIKAAVAKLEGVKGGE